MIKHFTTSFQRVWDLKFIILIIFFYFVPQNIIYHFGKFSYYNNNMRVFNYSTLKEYWKQYIQSEQQLKIWHTEAVNAEWNNSAELKKQFRTASIINNKRVVFNIKGNDYRLIVDVEFTKKAIFIVWFGTHKEYDKIDAEKVSYEE